MPKVPYGYSKNGIVAKPLSTSCANSSSRYCPQRSATATPPKPSEGSKSSTMRENGDSVDGKTVQGKLRRHRRVGDTDPAKKQHNLPAFRQ